MASERSGRRPEAPAPVPLRPESTDPVPSGPPSVDEMSEWSFPASDPPPAWTWEIDRPPDKGPRGRDR
jgi:hypothetical protein